MSGIPGAQENAKKLSIPQEPAELILCCERIPALFLLVGDPRWVGRQVGPNIKPIKLSARQQRYNQGTIGSTKSEEDVANWRHHRNNNGRRASRCKSTLLQEQWER